MPSVGILFSSGQAQATFLVTHQHSVSPATCSAQLSSRSLPQRFQSWWFWLGLERGPKLSLASRTWDCWWFLPCLPSPRCLVLPFSTPEAGWLCFLSFSLCPLNFSVLVTFCCHIPAGFHLTIAWRWMGRQEQNLSCDGALAALSDLSSPVW